MGALARLLLCVAMLWPLAGGAAVTYYKVHMTGAGAGVATSADATALLSFDLSTNVLTWHVNHRGLSSAGTSLRLHASGLPLLSGDVDIDLPFATSPITGTRVLTNGEMNGVALANWTLEIRTAGFPGGEIRAARLIQGPVAGYSFGLDGAQAGVPGAGTGHAFVTLDVATSKLTWDVTFSNLSSPATQVDFHGPAGRFASAAATGVAGAQGSIFLDASSAADLLNETWYVDVHTESVPSGEIRGQVVEPVTVQVSVLGNGRVVSDPPGIDCPGICSHAFDEQQLVTLTALPGAGAAFKGWNTCAFPNLASCLGTARGLSFMTAEFAAPQAPSFTSASTATFEYGGQRIFQVSVSGVPKPTVTLIGTPPDGITFDPLWMWLRGGTARIPAGSYPVTLRASNSVATVDQAFTIKVQGSQSQTISFSSPPPVYVGTSVSLVASATSGLAVTITHETPAVCTVSGGELAALAVGTCILDAEQPGDSLYAAAVPVKVSIPIVSTAPAINSADHATAYEGSDLAFTFQVTGLPTPTVSLTGALPAGVSFSGSGLSGVPAAATRGTYPLTVNASNGNGPDATQSFTLIVQRTSWSIANLSTRMQVLTNNDVMIAGFILGGSVPKTVVVNVAGPSLVPFGITNALANPKVRLVRSSDQAIVKANDDWQVQNVPGDVAAITATGFQPNHASEPAVIATLVPGAYTAIVEGVGGTTGVGLVGVFAVDHPEAPLVNMSTRGQVLTGNEVMISGFIINGGPQRVVVSVAGPSLQNFGISAALHDPTLTLMRSSDLSVLATNDDWQTQTNPADVVALQEAGFQPNNPLEPAIIATLPPGAYTAIVSGVGGTTGVGLVGVFAVP